VRCLVPLLALVALAADVAGAPAARDSALRRVAKTSRARYYSVDRARVDVRRSEAYLERLESLFGRTPAGWSVDVVVHPAHGVLRSAEGAAASGITDLLAGRVDSVRAFHPHELVHAAAGRLGMPPAFFAEGLAVALSSGGRWRGRDIDAVAQGALMGGARLEPLLEHFGAEPDLDYPLAGSFVAFLLDSHGIEAMVEFLERCGPSPFTFEESFRAAYGRTIANASLAWRARLLVRGGSGWGWNDPATWPRSLQRSRPAMATRDGRPGRALPADREASVLLSPHGDVKRP
jgi:hypothetical protein